MIGIFDSVHWIVQAAALASGQIPLSACSGPESRQFDFWIGEWSVTDLKTKQPAGTSQIESIYAGCVLRENWTSDGFQGGSLNSFWRGDQKWHQAWMDSSGAFRHFVGGLDRAGHMIMTAEQPHPNDPRRIRLIRLSFTANPDGTVRQLSDLSDDAGKSWQPRYDFLYSPLKP